tara:strand:- start:106 stop:492 length:387 start_codon:yes stop_codon:yes gene_type:complete
MNVEISLRQYRGRRAGIEVTEPIDVIYCTHGTKTSKVGFIARANPARVALIRWFEPEFRKVIRDAVAELRAKEFDGYVVAEETSSIARAEVIEAYINGEIAKPKTTTIVNTSGEPLQENQPEEEEEHE